jgi:hypothetical protein
VSDISGVPILDVNSSGLSTFDGNVNIDGSLNVNQTDDNNGIKVFGYDDKSAYSGNLYIDSAGNFQIRQTHGVGSGYMQIHAENYLELHAASLIYTQANFRIYDAGTLSFGSGGDYKIKHNSAADNLIIHTDDNKGITLDNVGNATFTDQAFATTATSSGDASSTLTTKGYVDGLITGATIYRGAWDPSGGGYGSPDLSGVTQTSGYYYICSAAGTAEPNGTGCEPDSWETGDWVIWNDDIVDCAGTGTGGWQKIDNSSVLSGVGTGQTVALWEGASSVTDSETLGNAPITVSGNDTTFAGGVSIATDTGLVATAPIFNTSGTTSRAAYFRGNNILQFQNTAGTNKWEVVGRDGEYYVYKNDGTGSGMKYRINANGNHTFTGTVTLASGALSLSGTGRIQGVDTVTDNTDAANKLYVDNAAAAVPIGNYLPLAGGTMTGALAGTSASFTGALSSVGYSGTSGTFSTSVTAAGNSNSFGNTSIAALSATSGTFSLSVTAAGNSNSFGATTVTSNLTTNGVLTIQNAAPYIQWKNVAGTRLSYIQHNATNLVMSADTGQIQLDTAADNDILINPGGTGKVGIGTTTPSYKLAVSGGIQAGGKVTYTKQAGSLDTTGYDVAGLTTSTNGQSAGFTFTCFGHSGGYQKIVYSCYNGAGNWYANKVIDEGTNQLDVVASANSTTITFTFKSISGTMSYTPRVTVEAVGTAINSTYA